MSSSLEEERSQHGNRLLSIKALHCFIAKGNIRLGQRFSEPFSVLVAYLTASLWKWLAGANLSFDHSTSKDKLR